MATTGDTRSGTGTSTGLDENIAGALAYLFGLITGVIFFFVESDNSFVKFHAAQSIVFAVALIPIYIGVGVLQGIVSLIPRIGGILGLLFIPVYLVLGLGGFGLWLFLMYKAYSHEEWEIPVLGGFARSIAS